MTTEVKDNTDMLRFEISFNGELAGFAEYERANGSIAFLYTEVDPLFRGRGFGHKLVSSAVDASRKAGLSIEPQCSFVRSYLNAEARRAAVDATAPLHEGHTTDENDS
jgi:predicted GNAT family acetyltransferase